MPSVNGAGFVSLMQRKGVTVKTLATLTGVNPETITHIRTGRSVQQRTLARVLMALQELPDLPHSELIEPGTRPPARRRRQEEDDEPQEAVR